MAYKKGYKKGRGYRGKNRLNNYYRGAKQLYRDVRMLKSIVNTEKKFIDTATAGTTLPTNTTGTVVPLNTCVQGVNFINRTGLSIKMVSVEVEGYVTLAAAATSDYVKVSLVQDMQTNAALPGYGNIYDIATAPAPLSHRNAVSVDRYLVLKNWKLDLDSNGNQIVKFKCYKKIQIHTKYNNTNGGTIADIVTNGLYLTFSGINTSNFSTINYNCRVRFVDN